MQGDWHFAGSISTPDTPVTFERNPPGMVCVLLTIRANADGTTRTVLLEARLQHCKQQSGCCGLLCHAGTCVHTKSAMMVTSSVNTQLVDRNATQTCLHNNRSMTSTNAVGQANLASPPTIIIPAAAVAVITPPASAIITCPRRGRPTPVKGAHELGRYECGRRCEHRGFHGVGGGAAKGAPKASVMMLEQAAGCIAQQ